MPNWNEINENYLAHFGIPGMKWGIRRYQNRDGSLTTKGYARLEKKRGYVEYEANTNSAKYIKKHQKKIEKQVMKEHDLKTTNSKKFKEEYDKKIDEIYNKNYNKSVNSLMKQTVNRNKTIALLGVAGAITAGVLIKKYVNAKRENEENEENKENVTPKSSNPTNADLIHHTLKFNSANFKTTEDIYADNKFKLAEATGQLSLTTSDNNKRATNETPSNSYYSATKVKYTNTNKTMSYKTDNDIMLTPVYKVTKNTKTRPVLNRTDYTKSKLNFGDQPYVGKISSSFYADDNWFKSLSSKPVTEVTNSQNKPKPYTKGSVNYRKLLKKVGRAKHSGIDGKDYLVHYGIKDMHWGIRRFQNEDGTLTYEGRQRYYASSSAEAKVLDTASKGVADTAKAIHTGSDKRIYPNHYENLSDQELNDRIQRIEKERKYSDLVGDTKIQKPANYYIKETLQTVGSILGIAASAITVGMLIHKVSGARSGADKDPNKQQNK